MRALIWHAMTGALRTGAYWAAVAAYLTILLFFVMVWGEGLPLADGGTNWTQFAVAQQAILVFMLPWIGMRCGAASRRELTGLALAMTVRPSRLLLARGLGLAASLFLAASLALPLMFTMLLAGAQPVSSIAGRLAAFAGLASFAAASAIASSVLLEKPLSGWIAASLATLIAAFLLPFTPVAALLWMIATAVIVVPLLLHADARLAYLPAERV